MHLNRRQFVSTSVAASAALVLSGRYAGTATAAGAKARPAPGGHYTPNAAPLAPTAFLRLPPQAVTAKGWLATQLGKELDGLCGRYADTSHFLDFDTTGWVHPEKEGWEELPYWLRGYVDLAVVTRDGAALAEVRRWMDAILATRQDDGFFGPTRLRTSLNGGPDFWPFLPLIQAMRSWQEYDGDERVVPLLTGFFRYMNAQGPGAFNTSWVSLRWGDGLDSVYWLYNRTGDAFLLDLVDKIHANGADWSARLASPHNVNIAQGFREPAQYALRSKAQADTRASYDTYRLALAHGQFPGGGFAGDENIREGHDDPRQGFESCGIVEFMASHQLLTRLTGDPLWADRCEDLAFNSLPAALDPSGKAIHYVTSANSVDLDDRVKTDRQFQNGFAMQAYLPGVDQYRCCPHNYGMGWPYFTEELWLATPDRGLAAAMYAPSEVTATVADGSEVTVTEDTEYPFGDTVTFTVHTAKKVSFPLQLRIPAWCEDARLTVAGSPVDAPAGPAFTRVERTWSDGDTVVLTLPQRTAVRTWQDNHDAVSVDRGPLTYSLRIGETYERIGGSDQFPEYAVHASGPWNYGLVLDAADPTAGLRTGRRRTKAAADPFTLEGTPLTLTARARRLPDWSADAQQVVWPLQDSPARTAEPVETVTLVPMGAARLRVTAFPTASTSGHAWLSQKWYRLRNKHSGKVLGVDTMSTANSAHVVQFDDNGTDDHLWEPVPEGDGWYRLRNKHSGKVLGVDNMSTANSAHVVQFDDSDTDDHLWQFVPDTGDGVFRLRNRHSGKVLGVDNMSTANSAHVVQFEDSGTDDHVWELLS
ncbi:RICIN domain-containing protein [Streptomyces sp. NPDC049954]|uniref:RICIN domain-containing protein n=1 Tax=Streptomyces sp. NPDC049954 TaxID=3155779 RepID=UPI003448C732